MGDLVLKRFQVGSEGPFTSGSNITYPGPFTSSSVYGGGTATPATRRLAAEDATEWGYVDLTYEAPEETRGTYAAIYTHLLQMRMAKGKFSSLLYPDDLIWWLRAAVSSTPTVTTLPNTPQTVLASQAVTVSTLSLTGITQPNAQTDAALGKILVLVLTAGATNTTPITFTVNGTGVTGAVVTETVNFDTGLQTLSKVGGGPGATTCTLYTQNYFATITSITASSTTTGDSVTIQGVNGFLWVFTPDMATSSVWSLTGEYFDGSTPWQLPGLILPKLGFKIQVGKSVTMSGDGLAKDMVPLGSMTAINDQVLPAISSYQAKYYSDNIGAVPGTTLISARLIDAQLDIENAFALGKAADGTPNPSFVARKRYKTKGEMTLLFNSGVLNSEDPADFGAFNNKYQSKTVMVAMPAVAYLPCGVLTGTLAAAGWPTQLGDSTNKAGLYGLTVAHSGKFIAGAPANVEGRLAVKLTHDMEVDLTSMNAAYQIQVVNRVNPNMH